MTRTSRVPLVGKKVGVQRESATYIMYQAVTKKLGIDRSKLEELPQTFDLLGPLLAKQMDLTMDYITSLPTFYAKGYPNVRVLP